MPEYSAALVAASIERDASSVRTMPELAKLLRHLRRREARGRDGAALTYRELAAKTGWSHGIIGEYLAGTALPPTDRFDQLVQLLGATRSELGPLATARDRVEELRRPSGAATGGTAPVAPSAPSAPVVRVPQELPAPVPAFVGRQVQLAELDRLSEKDEATRSVVAICGGGGVGKTELAVHWAHRRIEHFPDGQLYVDLRGFASTEPVDAADALARFLHALGVEPARMPAGTDERAARYRTMLAGRRMLVVLDNASSAEHVRPLLPGSPDCLVVVTSRDSLAGLVAVDGACRLELDVLDVPEAVALLRVLLGERVAAAPDVAEALAGQCGRLPLALRVFAEQAAARVDTSLAELVADLRDQQARLDLLDAGDARSRVRSVLSWSYERLSAAAARLFRLLGGEPGPDLGLAAIASLGAVAPAAARQAITELTRAHMLTEVGPGRYAMHDVLRAYAAELLSNVDSADDRRAALLRLLDHYLHSAVVADRLIDPSRIGVEIADPAAGAVVDELDTVPAAQAWFGAERATLLAATRLAGEQGFAEHAWQLPWALMNYLERSGYWHEWMASNAVALGVAVNPLAAAHAHRGLGRAATRLRRFDTALTHFERASKLCERMGDELNQAILQVSISEVHLEAGRPAEAIAPQQRALSIFRALGHEIGQARALNNLGYIRAQLGDYAAGVRECRESLVLWRRLGDRGSAAPALDSLGYLYYRMGHRDEAIRHFREALVLSRERGHRLHQAAILTHLGDAYRDTAQRSAAEDAWRTALSILDDLGHPDAAGVQARLWALRSRAGG